jgi:membrane-bound ClpP family serine protease
MPSPYLSTFRILSQALANYLGFVISFEIYELNRLRSYKGKTSTKRNSKVYYGETLSPLEEAGS